MGKSKKIIPLAATTRAEQIRLIRRSSSRIWPYKRRFMAALLATVAAAGLHVSGYGLFKLTLYVIFHKQDAIEENSIPKPITPEDSLMKAIKKSLKNQFVVPLYQKVLLPLQDR